MATIINNDKGFRVIAVSAKEMLKIGCGIPEENVCVCDNCNEAHEGGFMVAVLNMWFCPECYENWYERAVRYKEDEGPEEATFTWYRTLLGI